MTMLSGGMVDGCFKYFVFRASDGKAAVFFATRVQSAIDDFSL